MPEVLLDAAGRPRSPVTVPGYHSGRSPRNNAVRRHRPNPRARVVSRRRALNCATPPCGPGVRRRFAPHQLRHTHAVEMAREGVPLIVIQRQRGHTNLGITSIYLQGIDSIEIIDTVHPRRRPMVPVDATLRL